jgi:hypothetical protein
MNNKIIYWLRWIVVLPGAILAGFLITFPLHWLLYITFAHNGTLLGFIELPPRSDIWIEQLLYPFVMAIIFITAGHYIAPKYKFKSAIALFTIYATLWVGVVILSFYGDSLYGVDIQFSGRTVLAIVGAILGLYIAKKSDEKK